MTGEDDIARFDSRWYTIMFWHKPNWSPDQWSKTALNRDSTSLRYFNSKQFLALSDCVQFPSQPTPNIDSFIRNIQQICTVLFSIIGKYVLGRNCRLQERHCQSIFSLCRGNLPSRPILERPPNIGSTHSTRTMWILSPPQSKITLNQTTGKLHTWN